MAVDTVIFDFGGVLLDWNPRNLYSKIFDDEQEMEYFLDNVCTPHAWNHQADEGRLIADITKELIVEYPKYKSQVGAFYERWEEMFSGRVDGVLDIVEALYKNGVPLYGLTNWSAEKKYYFYEAFPRLKDFKDIVVSGVEKVAKPSPEIYQILLGRNGLDPKTCLFVDDRLENIEAGQKLGIAGHHFTTSAKLRLDLQARSLL